MSDKSKDSSKILALESSDNNTKLVHFNSGHQVSSGGILIWIATVLFVAKYFICRGPLPLDKINFISVEISGILALYFFSILIGLVKINVKYMALILGGYIVLLCHLVIAVDRLSIEYVIMLSRLYAYIVIVFIYVVYFFNWNIFYRVLLIFCYASMILAVVGTILFPTYFSEFGYGFSRARAMFSEPSAFAPVISIVLFDSTVKKNIFGIILSLFVAHLAASGVVYFVLVFMLIVFFIRYIIFQKINKKKLIVLFSIPIFIILTVILLSVYHSEIIKELKNSFNYKRSVAAIQSITDEGRGSSRLPSLFNYYKIFKNEGGLFFGRGFNGATVYFGEDSKLNENREYSILHSFFFAFGIFGIAVLIFILFRTWFYINKMGNVFMLITFSAFLFSSLLNSSGGHTLYKFCYIFIFVSIIYKKKWFLEKTFSKKSRFILKKNHSKRRIKLVWENTSKIG